MTLFLRVGAPLCFLWTRPDGLGLVPRTGADRLPVGVPGSVRHRRDGLGLRRLHRRDQRTQVEQLFQYVILTSKWYTLQKKRHFLPLKEVEFVTMYCYSRGKPITCFDTWCICSVWRVSRDSEQEHWYITACNVVIKEHIHEDTNSQLHLFLCWSSLKRCKTKWPHYYRNPRCPPLQLATLPCLWMGCLPGAPGLPQSSPMCLDTCGRW